MSKKINPTPAQRVSIELRGHTMLVSAAAGSGKTAVLTQRILELLTDKKNPVDISELIVVTYTKAAAAELKERISAALYDALRENPDNKNLANQILRVGKAKISTIHSFCGDVVRSNFQRLGLPPTLRIADDNETKLIKNEISNELVDSFYAGIHNDIIADFAEFTEDFLRSNKDDSLTEHFTKIYDMLRNYPVGIEMLNKCSEEYKIATSAPVLESKWGKKIKESIIRSFTTLANRYDKACEYFLTEPEFVKMRYDVFDQERAICYDILNKAKTGNYSELSAAFIDRKKVSFQGKKVNKDLQDTDYKRHMAIRSLLWEDSTTIKNGSKYFIFSEKTIKEHFARLSDICKNLYAFLSIYDRMYRDEKKRRGILDYSDLENYMLKLLYDDVECAKYSEYSETIRSRYKYVFIDEYQDVNELQDKIFSAISTSTNRFMVGDIKQSIYSFRGAQPDLFSDYRKIFPECVPPKNENEDICCPDSDGVTVYLSNNFRSDRTVLDFSNAVFEVLFNNNSGKMEYTHGDRLIHPNPGAPNDDEHFVRLCFASRDDDKKAVEREAEFVADEIEKFLNDFALKKQEATKKGVKLEYPKIAILFRSMSNSVYYEQELKKRNIPCFNKHNGDFFENDAVLLMVCLLNAVDNPARDIYLAGLLKSPLFGFTLSDLTRIRSYGEKTTLYSALEKYASEVNDPKCDLFFEKLKKWRKFAEGCPVDKFIRYIYNDTHMVELLSGDPDKLDDAERQANLLLLYEYARRFENGSFKGLYNFNLYLKDLMDKKIEIGKAKLTGGGEGVVELMTIHNSKGLEFDLVFLSDTAKKFNRDDENKPPYILHKEMGFTSKLRDKTTFARYNTFAKAASEISLREDSIDEEMRVLYVALTRAKKRLVITSSLANAQEFIDVISSDESPISHDVLLNCNNMAQLLLWGLYKSGYKDFEMEFIKPKDYAKKTSEEKKDIVPPPKYNDELISLYESKFTERLWYNYNYSELANIPSKLAVSRLYPDVLDEYSTDVSSVAPSAYVKPKFLIPEKDRFTAAEKGTATHVFMQFCDFENIAQNGFESEKRRLVDKGFIDERSGNIVNQKHIEAFFESDLYRSLKNSKSIWRERRFNIKLPASQFTSDEAKKLIYENESILVQGVIDLLFVDENDNLVLADYKTDHFSKEQIENGEAERILCERHRVQLSYYAEACKRIFGRAVDKIVIYSFALNKPIEIK